MFLTKNGLKIMCFIEVNRNKSYHKYVEIYSLTLSLSITIFLITCLFLVVAGDGVVDKDLGNIEREGDPATDEKYNSKSVCMWSWRIEHSPDTIDSIQYTEVNIQTKLDPTTARWIFFSPNGIARHLT